MSSTVTANGNLMDTPAQELKRRIHAAIPGGSHTYAKGDDQWPESVPALIACGKGCRVWDTDGHEFIEYAPGSRAVTLGHGYPPVVAAAARQLELGVNFTRPAAIELEAAEELRDLIAASDMVKFTKDGSTATTAAVKLARAHTGRDIVAICADHPFFSYDDWYIASTDVDAGIPQNISRLSVRFRYNDMESVRALFRDHPGRIACVILEAEKHEPPRDDFLRQLQDLCAGEGALFIIDEMITGFRHHLRGAQAMYGLTPDLSTFGKAIANGFAVSALVGKREIMERGGLQHEHERVFLLSTTHGGETHALAAAIATMRVYREEPVIETLYARGERLRAGVTEVARSIGVDGYFEVLGRDSNLVFATRDADLRPSQLFRTLFLQEMVSRGVLAPSFVVTYSHTDEDIDRTIAAVAESLVVYARALEDGPERYLQGSPVKSVYRRHNSDGSR
jgi:glutamate-1-semialdehyde 2,1-aminomutase